MTRHRWSRDEIKEYRRGHGYLFYFNKEDSNLFIPKTSGLGLTMNWGNPIAWVILAAILGIIIERAFLK